jgi:hypothetical protein
VWLILGALLIPPCHHAILILLGLASTAHHSFERCSRGKSEDCTPPGGVDLQFRVEDACRRL